MSQSTDTPTVQLFVVADILLVAARLLAPPRSLAGVLPGPADRRALLEAASASSESALAAALEGVLAQLDRTPVDVWASEHTRLFDGPIACPINETAYIRRDKGMIIADICGFYNAFGFDRAERSGEKPDHLRCELEFAAMLVLMLAVAERDPGDPEAAAITRDGLRLFLTDHLGEWIGLFRERLCSTTDLPLYVRWSDLVRSLWDRCADLVGAPTLEMLERGADEDDEPDAGTPYECDMAVADGDEPPFVPLTVSTS